MTGSRVATLTIDGLGAPFRIAATERGVVAAGWELDEDEFRARLVARLGLPLDGPPYDPRVGHVLDLARSAVEVLLRGRPTAVEHVPIDLADRPAWDRRVLLEVRNVPWGHTASYGDIARRIGTPRAARAVGGALGRNPISLLIPCHRIIAGDGTIGGYGGTGWVDRDRQRSRKEALLLREGVTVRTPAH
jgi:methylated-DNA-[protein]-cysteine S-methyltransferase